MRAENLVQAVSSHKSNLILYGFLLAAAFWSVIGSLTHQWIDDPNYTHGLFVVPMTLWLIWRRRDRLASIPVTGSRLGLALMIVAILIHLTGVLAAELFTTRFGFVMCVGSLVIATQGMERGRKLLFPLLFLFLMIPLPYIVYYKLTFPLQLLSSRIAADTLAMMGMPVVRSGNVIYLEHYTLEVVTACSGLRSIMTLGTMSVFLTDMFRFGILRKMILVFCVIPIAIIANTVRLILTAVVSAVASPEVADSFLHDLSGIVLFMIGLLALLLVGRMLEWKPEQQGS